VTVNLLILAFFSQSVSALYSIHSGPMPIVADSRKETDRHTEI